MALTLVLEVYLRLSFPFDFLHRFASTSDHKASVLHTLMLIDAPNFSNMFQTITLMGIRISTQTGFEAFMTVFLSSVLTM